MTHNDQIIQDPAPGTRLVRFCRDILNLNLQLPGPQAGTQQRHGRLQGRRFREGFEHENKTDQQRVYGCGLGNRLA